MASSEHRRVILSIQHLRGVAALMVVWHHAAQQVPGLRVFFSNPFGASGVNLFFVISGFIMVAATSGRNTGVIAFMQRRVQRIVPLYWLLTLLMVAVALVAPSVFKTLVVRPDALAMSLLFIPHYSPSFPDLVVPLLVPGWTLNFEMYFYLVFGLILFVPEQRRAAVLLTYFALSVALGWAFGPFQSALARIYTHPMLLEFVAGTVIARAWLAGRVALPLGLSLAAIGLGFALLVTGDTWLPVQGLGRLIGASLVVVGALHHALLDWRQGLLKALGDASYSVYLTHLFALGALRSVWVRAFPEAPTLGQAIAFMGLALAGCSAVGIATYVWAERPLLARLLARRGVRATAGAG